VKSEVRKDSTLTWRGQIESTRLRPNSVSLARRIPASVNRMDDMQSRTSRKRSQAAHWGLNMSHSFRRYN
jgi:hypothetical protein